MYERGAEVTRRLQEALSGVQTVKLFAAEEREAQRIERSLRQFLHSGITQSVVSSLSNELVLYLGALAGFVVLGVSSLEIIAGHFSVGNYMAFAAYMGKVYADEATSQLDPESEQRLCQALAQAFAGKTLIVIAHRLSTVLGLAVDRVFEVAEGRLSEVGLPYPNQAVDALPLVAVTGVPQAQAAE